MSAWAAAWLTVLGAVLLAPSPARADCAISGSTITCSDTGGTQTTPVGTGAEDGMTVNVQSGAVIDLSGSAGATAIDLNDNNTVVNSGAVIASDNALGISVNNSNSVANHGTVTVGDNGIGISGCCDNIIVNYGTISAGDSGAGIVATDGNTITNNSVITAGTNGAGISVGDNNTIANAGSIIVGDGFGSYGIAASFNNTIVNSGSIVIGQGGIGLAADANSALPAAPSITNSGTVTVGDFGIGIIVTDFHNVLNSGRITVGQAGYGIQTGDNNLITNTGTIVVDSLSSGVQFDGINNTLNNSGTIKAINDAYSIDACACTAINNNFNNLSGGTLDGYVNVDGVGNTLTNSGVITVTDPGTALVGYPTFLIANQSLSGAGNNFVQTTSGTLALRMNNTGLIDNLSADAIIAGGTLKVMLQAGQLYQNSTISGTAVGLTVYGAGTLGNTITTRFDAFATSSVFFTATPIYDTGDASAYTSLNLQLDRTPFGSVPGSTPTQQSVGNALEQGYSPSLDPNSTIGQFYANLLAASSLGVLDQLSGAGTSAAQNAAFSSGALFGGAMMQQGLSWLSGSGGGFGTTFGGLPYAAPANRLANHPGADAFAAMQPQPGRWRVWGAGFGATRSIDGQNGSSEDQRINAGGGAFGVDREIARDLLLGFAVGASGSTYSVSGLSTSGRSDAGHVGVYALKTFGASYLAATLYYAHAANKSDRTITGIGATEYAKGSFDSDQLGGRVEFGWRHALKSYTLTPFVAVEPAVLWQQGYSEASTTGTGAPGILGLTYQSNRVTSFPAFLGAQIDGRYALDGGHTVSPFARLSWVHEFETARNIRASFITLPGGSFIAEGARASENALRLEAGATLSLSDKASLFASVNGEWSNTTTSVAGLGGLRLGW